MNYESKDIPHHPANSGHSRCGYIRLPRRLAENTVLAVCGRTYFCGNLLMTYPDQFEEFWTLYPKGCRNDGCGSLQGGKKDAYRAWLGLDAQEKKDARAAVEILKKHQYLPHASRWLRSGMYEAVLENRIVTEKARTCCICGAPDVVSQAGSLPWRCWRENCIVEYAKL